MYYVEYRYVNDDPPPPDVTHLLHRVEMTLHLLDGNFPSRFDTKKALVRVKACKYYHEGFTSVRKDRWNIFEDLLRLSVSFEPKWSPNYHWRLWLWIALIKL